MRSALRRALVVGIGALALIGGWSCADQTASITITTITLTPSTATLVAGDTLRLAAQLTDANGKPVTGQTVAFASSDTTIATVDAAGLVTAVRPGSAAITGSIQQKSAQASLTVTAGPPATLAKVSGDAQSGIVGAAAGMPLVVKVTDHLGFPVSTVQVHWTVTGGGSPSPGTSTTDASGLATTSLTLAPKPATSTITAAVTGVSATVAFTATSHWSTARDDWTTVGHDAHRSAAVATNIVGPLHLSWKYTPPGVSGHTLVGIVNLLATSTGVWVRSSLNAGYGYGLSPALDKVTLAGQHVWTYNMGTDADFGNWATISGSKVVLNDDGIRYVDMTSGASTAGGGVDSWGELLSDPTGLWLENSAQIDGPGILLGKYDATGHRTWTQNAYSLCRGAAATLAGGLALNGSVLFYAPAYNVGADTIVLPFQSGVYAFDAAAGTKLAFVASTPYSRVSADGSRVYLVEGDINSGKLVARAQSDLHVVWSASLGSFASMQAPVVANGLVITATNTAVKAYNASTGALTWSTNMNGAGAYWSSTYQGGKCGLIQIPEGNIGSGTARLAAALGSKTLIVTASDGIHLLSLANGADTWHATITGVPLGVSNPVLVNDPTQGPILYVHDYQTVYAIVP